MEPRIKINRFPFLSVSSSPVTERGVQQELADSRPENSLFLEGYHGNPPPPPPQRREGGRGGEGRSQREWRIPFLDLMFSFLFPFCLTNFLMSQMIQHYLCLHGCMPSKIQRNAFLLLTFDKLISIVENIFPLNLWLLLSFPWPICALFLALHLVYTMPYISFVFRRTTVHTDVV